MITSAKNYTKINIQIRNTSVSDSKPQVYSCSQNPPPQFWVNSFSIQVFHRCRVPKVNCGDLIHCSWGCWEKFPFLFFVCTAPGVQLWVWPHLCVLAALRFLLLPRQDGLKQRLIRGLWLTQAWGREWYSSYNWNARWACGSRGQRDVTTAWGMPCVLLGKLSLDHGTLAVVGCTGSQVVWIVRPVPAHRILGGCSSSVSISCPSLGPELIAAACPWLWSLFRWCSAFCGHTVKESPLFAHPKTMVSCLLGRSRLFPRLPSS